MFKRKKDDKYILKGSVSKSDILYDHPSNNISETKAKNRALINKILNELAEEKMTPEVVPPMIEPVIIPFPENVSDISDKVINTPTSRHFVNKQKDKSEKIDYINKPANNSFKLDGSIKPEQIVMKPQKRPVNIDGEYDVIGTVKFPKNSANSQIQHLKKQAKQELFDIEKERWIEHSKNWSGAAFEIGSALIPAGVTARVGISIGKTLTPIVGKQIGKRIGQGAVTGGVSSAVYGYGRGLLEDKNPLLTSFQDGFIGLGFGSALGLGGGSLEYLSNIRGINNVKINPDLPEKTIEKYKKLQKKYNAKYVEGEKEELAERAINAIKDPDTAQSRNIKSVELRTERVQGVQKLYPYDEAYFEIVDGVKNPLGRVYKPNPQLKIAYSRFGWKYDNYIELNPDSKESAELFVDVFRKNNAKNLSISAQVYEYPIEEYEKMKLFVSENGTSGFAIKPDGDIVSVFSSQKGSSPALLELAIQQGGRKLDCFDTFLPDLYTPHRFIKVGESLWDDRYMPQGWDKNNFILFNNGEPKVLYFELDKNRLVK